jgi:hypothetical protein
MLRYEALSTADPDSAWALIARPARWHEWAPHLRGAWGLGDPEVRPGARGAARLLWAIPIPAAVTARRDADAERSWTWRVGPVVMDHYVAQRPGGSVVGVDLRAPAAVEALLRVSYGPVVRLLVGHLARVAARDAATPPRPRRRAR